MTIFYIYISGYIATLFVWILSSEQRDILRAGETDIQGILIGSLLYPLSIYNIFKDIIYTVQKKQNLKNKDHEIKELISKIIF